MLRFNREPLPEAVSSDTRRRRRPAALAPGPAASGPGSGEVSAAPISADLGHPLAAASLKAGPNRVRTCKATAENLPMVLRRVTVWQGT